MDLNGPSSPPPGPVLLQDKPMMTKYRKPTNDYLPDTANNLAGSGRRHTDCLGNIEGPLVS